MKALILCGGKGLRIKGHFDNIPKPLILVHGKELLLRIIEQYKLYGIHHFILLVGDDEEDFMRFSKKYSCKKIIIDVVATGSNTCTGGRLKKVEYLLSGDISFFMTYGDGLSDVNFTELLHFHESHGKMVTLTAVKPQLQFGALNLSENFTVKSFTEKPILNEYINAGFFVLNREIFNILRDDSDFENEILPILSNQEQLKAYKHTSFWKNVDTYKDYLSISELLKQLK
jgi:glucose-1-phosphate cytidylyltransferase